MEQGGDLLGYEMEGRAGRGAGREISKSVSQTAALTTSRIIATLSWSLVRQHWPLAACIAQNAADLSEVPNAPNIRANSPE